MSYRISTVAEMTGIPRNTLIAWERRYGLLNPDRHDNGYRSYTEQDVGVLLQIKNALNAGLKISEAVALIRKSEPRAPREPVDIRKLLDLETSGAGAASSPYDEFCSRLLHALLTYQGEEARTLLGDLINVPFEIKLHEVFFPVLRRLGELWQQGEASVAQEHFASAIIRTHLAAQFVTTAQAPLDARHAVCTTLPHDEHEIAALALAIQLSSVGYRVSYLGAKMPAEALTAFLAKRRAHMLCVSCITLPPHDEFEAYVTRLAEIARKGTRVVLGGHGLAAWTTYLSQRGIEVHTNWRDFAPR